MLTSLPRVAIQELPTKTLSKTVKHTIGEVIKLSFGFYRSTGLFTRSITSVTSWGGQVQELCVWVVLVCFGGWGDMEHAESRVLANQTLRGSLLG